jgi:hypothetical protein
MIEVHVGEIIVIRRIILKGPYTKRHSSGTVHMYDIRTKNRARWLRL